MKTFGPKRNADSPVEHVDVPVGDPCMLCGLPMQPNDQGLIIPHVAETCTDRAWHSCCFRDTLGV